MPKFLDNIEFYTEGYNEESLEISKEIKPIDLNEEWNTETINLEIPKTTITYPYEPPEKKRITDISRDIEKEKDEALYKIEELSKSGLNAANTLTQKGLNALNSKTQDGLDALENKTQEGLDELGSKIQEANELIETGKTDITNLTNEFNLENGTGENSVQQKYIVNGVDYSANADGINSVALGGKRFDKLTDDNRAPTSAEGNQSFAAGASVHAHGDFSVAFGKDNDAYQRGGFVTGGGCRVGMTEEEFNAFYWDDVNNIPLNDGKGKNADGKITDFENKSYEQSYSFGFTSGTINKALGRDSFATGLGAQALGRTSFASGMGSKALGSESFAAGRETYATGSMSAAFGYGVDDSEEKKYGIRGATGKCSFVAGRSANATGDFSQAFGYFTQATGWGSFAAGNNTEATGEASVSLGNGTYAGGDYSASFGLGEVSNHTVNNTLGALGNYSTHVGCKNIAGGTSSFASGQGTKALADYSFSSGFYSTIESGATASFASGSSNTIKGAKAFVAGESNTVEGTGSFAAGIGNTAGGYASVVLGRGLISNATGQFIAGQYNDENYLSSMAFAIGGGSNVDNVITRKNLLTLYKDGRLRLTQPTANLTDNDVTRLKDVKNLITEIDRKFEALDSDFFNSIY